MKKLSTSILIILISILLIGILAISFRHKIKQRMLFLYGKFTNRIGGPSAAKCDGCNVLFNDGINTHELAYRNEKINEQQTDNGLLALEQKGVLQNIESNDFYTVQDFSHSKPLLLSKAVFFLDKLSRTYQENCINAHLTYIPFEISSATRSRNSVGKLQKENNNAIENSPHLRGKTFDVSYAAFGGNSAQLKLFVDALSQLKKQNRCYVKYERNGCLHITAN